MKFILILLVVFSSSAQAAVILSAKVDNMGENILVDLMYSGGCKEHQFGLVLDSYCARSLPVQCGATLIDLTEVTDMCETMVETTAIFNLKEYGLTDMYYNGATLTIRGSRTLTGEETSATVVLPMKFISPQ